MPHPVCRPIRTGREPGGKEAPYLHWGTVLPFRVTICATREHEAAGGETIFVKLGRGDSAVMDARPRDNMGIRRLATGDGIVYDIGCETPRTGFERPRHKQTNNGGAL